MNGLRVGGIDMNVVEERAKWKTIMTRPDTVINQTG